jgi:hemerythrin-like domain-containing protein
MRGNRGVPPTVRQLGRPVYRNGSSPAVKDFMRYARSYINLLRPHIAKEDECLANTVAATFPADERESLTRAFEEMERREFGERAFERFSAIVAVLEARYGDGSSTDPGSRLHQATR